MVLVTRTVFSKFFVLFAKNLTLKSIQIFSQTNENIHHIYMVCVNNVKYLNGDVVERQAATTVFNLVITTNLNFVSVL